MRCLVLGVPWLSPVLAPSNEWQKFPLQILGQSLYVQPESMSFSCTSAQMAVQVNASL